MNGDSKKNVLLIHSTPGEASRVQTLLTSQNHVPFALEICHNLAMAGQRLADGGIDAAILDLSLIEEQEEKLWQQILTQFPRMPKIVLFNGRFDKLEQIHLWDGTQDFLNSISLDGQLLAQTIVNAIARRQLTQGADESTRLAQLTLDGLSANIAVVDARGMILAVNKAWRKFADENSPVPANVLEGVNYLSVCDAACGPDSAGAAEFAEGLRAVLAGKSTFFQQEYPCHSPHELRWFLGRVTRFPEEAGPARAIVAHEDITARKLVEIKLEKFSWAVEQAPVSVLFTDPNGVIEYVNPKLAELTGYSADEMLGQTPRLFKSGRTPATEYDHLWETITGGDTWQGEFLNRKKDGTLFWESATISPVKDESGEISNFVAIKDDITQEKKAAAFLAESEQRYRGLFENASDAIFVTDMNGRFLDANEVACQRLEYNLQELKSLSLADIDPIEYSQLKPERLLPVKEDSYAFYETVHVTKNGKSIPTEVSVQFFQYGDQQALLSIARDITERRKVIRAEREARDFAEALVEITYMINNSLDHEQLLKEILNHVVRVVAYELVTIMLIDGENVQIAEIKDARHKSAQHALKGTRVKIADFPTLTRMMKSKTALVLPSVAQYSGWVKTSLYEDIQSYVGAPICTNGELIGFINLTHSREGAYTAKDAERLQAFADQVAISLKNARQFTEIRAFNADLEEKVQLRTEQLRHDKELLEAILFNSPNNILFVNLDSDIQLANAKFYEKFKLAESEVIGRKITAVLTIQDQALLEEMLKSVFQTSQSKQFESVAILRDGSKIDIELKIAPVKNGKISGVVCTIRDLTALKIAERAKDAFVANVSHELKSPITSLRLYYDLLRRKPKRQDRYLARLERETERLAHMVDDLLLLSKLEQHQMLPAPSTIDLVALLTNFIKDRQVAAKANGIRLKMGPLAQLPEINTDPGLLEQVMGILLTNAINYSSSEGEILVNGTLHHKNDAEWYGISFKDNGLGIAPEEQQKVFQRFYRGGASETTDSPGTGLGLAIAAEIVAKLNGKIELQSDGVPGEGSTFTIWLPVSN